MTEYVVSFKKGKSLADLSAEAGSLKDFLVQENIVATDVMPTGTTIVVSLSQSDRTRLQKRYGRTMHFVERVKGHVL